MQIYGLRNCDSCRRAMKAMPGATLIDVREQGLPEDVLLSALEAFGAALVNTRSTTWRGLDEAARAQPPGALIRACPAVMKRPLILKGEELFLGWNKDIEAKVNSVP